MQQSTVVALAWCTLMEDKYKYKYKLGQKIQIQTKIQTQIQRASCTGRGRGGGGGGYSFDEVQAGQWTCNAGFSPAREAAAYSNEGKFNYKYKYKYSEIATLFFQQHKGLLKWMQALLSSSCGSMGEDEVARIDVNVLKTNPGMWEDMTNPGNMSEDTFWRRIQVWCGKIWSWNGSGKKIQTSGWRETQLMKSSQADHHCQSLSSSTQMIKEILWDLGP